MKCPTCRKEFHPQPDRSRAYSFAGDEMSDAGYGITVQLCPSCHNMIVIYQEGKISGGGTHVAQVTNEYIIFPILSKRDLPEEVPDQYRSEYEEASNAVEYSSKASAALSRRLLQKVLREELGIRKKDLSQEIDEFISKSGAPAYLTGALDAVRTVGNFASHPMKYLHTGEIVDVEDGEAEWILEVLESLFDFVFVQPARLQQRKNALNEKLRQLGKPELKGA